VYVEKPVVGKVKCLTRCASRRRAQAGSSVRVTGSGLSGAKALLFMGSMGRADDVRARIRRPGARRFTVRVPMDAVSGPVKVLAGAISSRPSGAMKVLPAPPPDPNPTLTPVPGLRERGAPRLETGTSRVRAFYGSRRTVTFSFRITGSAPATVRVELVRARDLAVVRAWTPVVRSGNVRKVTWNGRIGATPATPGRYSFRLTAAGPSGAQAHSAQAPNFTRDAFDLYDHIFPVPSRHDFGGAGARFGTGRAGHSHQGHDVFARCGSRMLAARGGRVKAKAYHRAAGHYLVIDGAGIGVDYAYMHLAEASPFEKGDRVYTGQRIGAVGDSGNARGCHLHFELWSAPGWYTGGRPFDPLVPLQLWDAWS
jgi:murein DD-endopeptidase MepM/ murein hydrolase activator NlpD